MRSYIRSSFLSVVTVAAIVTGVTLSAAVTPAGADVVPQILILNSYNMGYDWSENEMVGVRDGFAEAFPRTVMFIEYLDTKNIPSKKHFPVQADLLVAKYANRPLDVIIAMDNAALEFALKYRQRISPGTPLVFCGINGYEPAMIAGQPSITGVDENLDSVGTLGLALQIHPGITDVFVLHDFTDTGLVASRELEKGASRYPGVKLHFMEEMPLEKTVKKLTALTPDHIVMLLAYTVEKGGRTFLQSEAARLVSGASPVPVYSPHMAQLGAGVVGGRMMGGQIQGQKAAELAVRIIGGELPEKLPVISDDLSRPMFDFRMLEKFDIDPYKLPADALLVNKPLTTVAVNKNAVWLGGLFTLFCSTGLVVMTLNIRKRKHLENMLRLQIDQYQESQVKLRATKAMLRVQLDAVAESSQKFRAVFEHSPIAIALTSFPEGVLSDVNQTFIDMSGYSREEMIGKSTTELGFWLHESDRERHLSLLKDKDYAHSLEVRIRRKNGEELDTIASAVMLKIGDKPFLLSTAMDISEQKRLHNQLLQSQKMDVVGQLAGGIAHDFNNMLAGIMASAELLKRRLTSADKNLELVEIIIGATTRSANLTRELLTFSRKGAPVSSPVHIHDTIASVISLLERTIDKQIQLSARLDASDPVVMGNETQLQNALLNLGVNARDAMPQGGTLTYMTTVRILDEDACRSVGLSLAPGSYLEIAVTDSGVGMTEEVMEHIFEPFFTTKGVGKGTGLGLASVYGVVKNNGGDICVQSAPGHGSVFKIFLPLLAGEPCRQTLVSKVVVGSGGILLVDDEEMLRSAGRDLLENLGYTVYLAENGERALEEFAAHRSDISLVILDIIMPKMGGKEAFLRFRELAPELKVLFCSGFSNDGTSDDLVKLGASGFIQKPYNLSQLSRAVAEAMES